MRQKSIFIILISFALFLSGCSYRYDFVVINQSDQPIEVQYKLKRQTPDTSGKFVNTETPAKVSRTEFEKANYEWRNLEKSQFEFDNLTGTFRVSVAPDEVLLVDYAYNYRGDENEFDLASIKIEGARGSIDLEGQQTQTQFKIEGDTKYILRYR